MPGFPGSYRGAPVEAAFTPDGSRAYVSNYELTGPRLRRPGHDICSPSSGYDRSFVYRLDVARLRIDRAIAVGSVPKALAVTPDGRLILISNWCSYSLSVISTRLARQVREIPLGRYPRGVAVDRASRFAYIAVMGSFDVARLDLRSFRVSWLRRVGNAPRSMAIAPDGRSLYGSNTVSKIRTRDMAVVQTVVTAARPIGIAYDGLARRLWVACYSGVIEIFADA